MINRKDMTKEGMIFKSYNFFNDSKVLTIISEESKY